MAKAILDPYKDMLVKLAVKQVMQYAISRAAWLALGPVNFIAGYILSKIFLVALENTILGVNMLMIDMETDQEVKEFTELIKKAKATPKEDMEASNAIEKELIEAGNDLIRIMEHRRL